MKVRRFVVSPSVVLMASAAIMQRTMEVRGPGPASAEACKPNVYDVPSCARIAHGLALAVENAFEQMHPEGWIPSSLNFTTPCMAAACSILTRVGDFRHGSEIWDNEHYRAWVFDVAVTSAMALEAKLEDLARIEQDRRNVDS